MSQLWQDYCIITLTVVLWNRMVNVVGRVGELEEAKLALDCLLLWHLSQVQLGEPYVVPVERTYGNTKLGEFAATELLKLEPKDSDIL
jgi:hypothetical protein